MVLGLPTTTEVPGFGTPEFKEWLVRQIQEITENKGFSASNILALVPQHKEPVRPRQGYVVYADGTDWNPGSGEGVYRHDGTNWNFLG